MRPRVYNAHERRLLNAIALLEALRTKMEAGENRQAIEDSIGEIRLALANL